MDIAPSDDLVCLERQNEQAMGFRIRRRRVHECMNDTRTHEHIHSRGRYIMVVVQLGGNINLTTHHEKRDTPDSNMYNFIVGAR
jgi:hypothetical protein